MRVCLLLLTLLLSPVPVQAATDYTELLNQAIGMRNAGDFDGAEAALERAGTVAADPQEADHLRALVIAFQQRHDESLSILERLTQQYPDNTEYALSRARVLAFAGDYGQARTILDRLLEQDRQNIPAALLNARIALYRNQPDSAYEQFLAVAEDHPDDLEALIGLHDAGRASGNDVAARSWLQRAIAVAPEHSDVVTRREAVSATRQHLVTAGYSTSRFSHSSSRNLPDWQERHLEYRHVGHLDREWYVRGEDRRRFGLTDQYIEAGIDWNRRSGIPLSLRAGFTPDADFSTRWQVVAGTSIRLGENADWTGTTVLIPTIRHARYENGNVQSIHLDAEHYLTDVNAWLTPGINWVRDQDGNTTAGWHIGGHWQFHTAWRTGVRMGRQLETENLRTRETRSQTIYLQWQWRPSLALRLDAGRSERRDSYTRNQFSLSLSTSF